MNRELWVVSVNREWNLAFCNLLQSKNSVMKKIFVILTIALFLEACSNSREEKTTITTDSGSTESPLIDAVNTAGSAGKILHDSTGKMPDSMRK